MDVDIGNALASEASPGVSREELDALDDRVAAAHETITDGMAEAAMGYDALNLPEQTDPARIRETVAPVADATHVVTVGIGGSALGARTITSALADHPERHVVLDNVDPAHVERALADLPLSDTALNVVSKSGTTTETMANFLVTRQAYEDAGVDWTERTVVTTGDSGPLAEEAATHDLPRLPIPDTVPGRFAALSAVGLVPAAVFGLDLEGLLDGAAAEADRLAPSLYDSPAYAYGAVAHALEERGAGVNAFMPYAESLEGFAEWFAQLWAESLGKAGTGQTPARALGATDQHSQLQLYRDGPSDKQVTFVTPRNRPDLPVPPAEPPLENVGGTDMGELLDVERKATEASLADAGLPNVRVTVDAVDAEGLGELLFGMEAACIMAGELADVSTFTQPAVEWSKDAMRDILADVDSERRRAVEEKTTLVVD